MLSLLVSGSWRDKIQDDLILALPPRDLEAIIQASLGARFCIGDHANLRAVALARWAAIEPEDGGEYLRGFGSGDWGR